MGLSKVNNMQELQFLNWCIIVRRQNATQNAPNHIRYLKEIKCYGIILNPDWRVPLVTNNTSIQPTGTKV